MMDKKVLYIGTPFFDYYKKIIDEFENQGYMVDFYNDRPSENSFLKGIIRLRKSLMTSLIQKYFDRIINETRNEQYDLVFIVNCKVFTPSMVQELRVIQKKAKFVLYMWDSLKLYPNSKELIHIFDVAYSFDSKDCEENEKLSFLPLFYSKAFENLGEECNYENRKYDIVSICTAHPNRYLILKSLIPALEASNIRIYSFMYLNKFQYYYNKFFLSEFKGAHRKEFSFEPLSEQGNLNYLNDSIAVLDMQHSDQSGLTMRSIETLGAKRKFITTNDNIKFYDFYDESNIFILNDESNISDLKEFLMKEITHIDKEIYRKYSLRSWIENIINNNESIKYKK